MTRFPRQGPSRVIGAMVVAALAVAPLMSCGDSTGPHHFGPPATLEVVSGSGDTATVGTELAAPLVARVLDDEGHPVVGQLVSFRVLKGGGSVFAGVSQTNDDGIAQERWTLGTAATDSQVVEARAVDNNTGAKQVFGVFTATAIAGAPDTVVALPHTKAAGEIVNEFFVPPTGTFPESLAVRVADKYGNLVPGANVTWSLPAGAGNVSPTASTTSASGIATTQFTGGTVRGFFPLTVTASPASVVRTVIVGISPNWHIELFAGNGQSADVGTQLPTDPTIRLVDEFGNTVEGKQVNWVSANDGKIYSGVTIIPGQFGSVTTDAVGTARVHWKLGNVAGENLLHAQIPDAQPLEIQHAHVAEAVFSATGLGGAPTRMEKFAGDAQTAAPGSAMAIPPAVKLFDQFGNPSAGRHVTFTLGAESGSITGADAVSDANGVAALGSWTLRPTKGTNDVVASFGTLTPLRFTAKAGESTPGITVSIVTPPGSLAGDNVLVQADVTSQSGIASVMAFVGAQQTSLTLQSGTRWQGTVSLVGLPRDSLEITLTARDPAGGGTDAFVKVVHDARPIVTVSSPSEGSTAAPSMIYSATCTDDGAGCQLSVLAEPSPAGQPAREIDIGPAQINGELSLEDFAGGSIRVLFIATDLRGQKDTVVRNVTVVKIPTVTSIASATGTVLDVSGDKMLLIDRSTATDRLILRTISTGIDDTIPYANPDNTIRGFVSPHGAIFLEKKTSSANRTLYEWRDRDLLSTASVDSLSLKVSGSYAIHLDHDLALNRTTLFRRDLGTGVDAAIGSAVSPGGSTHAVAANGDVVFTTDDPRQGIFRYRAGAVTSVVSGFATSNSFGVLKTDGYNVMFVLASAGGGRPTIRFARNGVSTALSTGQFFFPSSTDYDAAGDWMAFMKEDASNIRQVWTSSFSRGATGSRVLHQVTFFGSHSVLEAVGSDGTTIFSNSGRRYLARAAGGPQEITPADGRVIWRDKFIIIRPSGAVFVVTP